MLFADDQPAADETAPCALGLLVGTLALMTAHASPEVTAHVDVITRRRLMTRKIVSNLFFLQHHPDTPPPLRQVAANLRAHWLQMAGAHRPAPQTLTYRCRPEPTGIESGMEVTWPATARDRSPPSAQPSSS